MSCCRRGPRRPSAAGNTTTRHGQQHSCSNTAACLGLLVRCQVLARPCQACLHLHCSMVGRRAGWPQQRRTTACRPACARRHQHPAGRPVRQIACRYASGCICRRCFARCCASSSCAECMGRLPPRRLPLAHACRLLPPTSTGHTWLSMPCTSAIERRTAASCTALDTVPPTSRFCVQRGVGMEQSKGQGRASGMAGGEPPFRSRHVSGRVANVAAP